MTSVALGISDAHAAGTLIWGMPAETETFVVANIVVDLLNATLIPGCAKHEQLSGVDRSGQL